MLLPRLQRLRLMQLLLMWCLPSKDAPRSIAYLSGIFNLDGPNGHHATPTAPILCRICRRAPFTALKTAIMTHSNVKFAGTASVSWHFSDTSPSLLRFFARIPRPPDRPFLDFLILGGIGEELLTAVSGKICQSARVNDFETGAHGI